MKKIYSYITNFFSAEYFSYSLPEPRQEIASKITEVLNSKNGFFDYRDIKGFFTGAYNFEMSLISASASAANELFSSTLSGDINETETGETQINIKIKAGFILRILFFVGIFLGIVYVIKFQQTHSSGYLFWSIAMLFLAPAFCIGFASTANYAIKESFEEYILKTLPR